MDLIITDVFEAIKLTEGSPGHYRVVSIVSANPAIRIVEMPFYLPRAKEVLYLTFDDIAERYRDFALSTGQFRLATEEDCRQALDFLSKGGPCLIHCEAGISRSTGTALGYLLTQYPDYKEAVDKLFEIRPCAQPNSHILRLMCQILHKAGEYGNILTYLDMLQGKLRVNFSICLNCGALKMGGLSACPRCRHEPQDLEDIVRHLFFTDYYYAFPDLEKVGRDIQSGKKPTVNPQMLQSFIKILQKLAQQTDLERLRKLHPKLVSILQREQSVDGDVFPKAPPKSTVEQEQENIKIIPVSEWSMFTKEVEPERNEKISNYPAKDGSKPDPGETQQDHTPEAEEPE